VFGTFTGEQFPGKFQCANLTLFPVRLFPAAKLPWKTTANRFSGGLRNTAATQQAIFPS